MSKKGKIRILIAKPGLDGHDRGAKVIARALRDAGMEVIYTGLRQSPEDIVEAAIQEDVQFIGLSILSGAHSHIFPKVVELLKKREVGDIRIIAGGIIPDEEIPQWKKIGIEAIFGPGSSTTEIIDYINGIAN
ncbi:MAG: cobalamin B12-binding domain-containing protein [Candidatus Thermoplasmatota archaeon]|jgi:methylmalonyl-CoA mutase C-terminal domain/subunit|nr:cobalamin B12-binding domain-containing protein [Candidatus Thermoplasmatota archaeon]